MDVSPTNAATPPPPAASSAFDANKDRFKELTSAVLDQSGKLSEEQRVQAYQDLHTMAVSGQLRGMSEDDRKVYENASTGSDIGKRSQQLQTAYIQSVDVARQAGGAKAALSAALSSYDALSSSDQNVLFKTGINAADRTGKTPYADVQGWRDNINAQQQMLSYMQSSGALDAGGVLKSDVAASKSAEDPTFAAATKLSQVKDNNSAAWTQAVLSLFKVNSPTDKVNLSDDAKKIVGDVPASTSRGYTEGSLASKKV